MVLQPVKELPPVKKLKLSLLRGSFKIVPESLDL